MSPSTMNHSPQSQLPSFTSRIPVRRTSTDIGMKTQRTITPVSLPNAAVRAGSPDAFASAPNTCTATAPPIHRTTAEMCRNSQSSYQVISSPPARLPAHLVEEPADGDVHDPDHDRGADVRP